MLNASSTSLWTWTVVAAIVTTVGTLVGHLLKEIVLARSFEAWKRRQTAADIERKYRDPIVLAALELASRLAEIIQEHPTDYLHRSALSTVIQRTLGSHRDAHFKKYKCQSTMYRIAAFLAWVELHRQELVFLESEHTGAARPAQQSIDAIRQDFADGQINESDDWASWTDALIFREEQRAIGEAMIAGPPPARTVVGYGSFITIAETAAHPNHRWVECLEHFCVDQQSNKEFRLVRYRRLLVHLIDLVCAIDPRRIPVWLTEVSAQQRLHLAKVKQRGFAQTAAQVQG
ncbi:MAG TPA: hypothetical protein VII75_15200 [Thermoanaerobaculia bacterium]|nr:hypothetical protein [Thermoanaerobaculia bacterium]